MPAHRYFFHTGFSGNVQEDHEGVALESPEAAWEQATKACGEFILEVDGNMKVGSSWQMTVTDDTGPLFEISLSSRRLR